MALHVKKSTGWTTVNSFYVKKSNEINRLIMDLKKKAYKDKIIAECAAQFYDSEFEEKLDENPNIIGFENGVYDLKKGIFRTGSQIKTSYH